MSDERRSHQRSPEDGDPSVGPSAPAGLRTPVSDLRTPIDLGSRRELFVDDFIIERMSGAALTLHRPTPREVAIVHDAPWEGNICAYHTVFQDGDRYRMYYRGAHFDAEAKKTIHQVVAYAESSDGIHWNRPELGLVEFNGSKRNCILWDGPGSHNFAPFKDSSPNARPEEGYKALAGGKGGLYPFKSADGLRWSLMSETPVITDGAFDSQNLAFWDTERGCYVDFHRKGRERVRDIMTCTSPDFLHWTAPVFLEYPGAPVEHLYTNQITPYYRAPHILMGFPKRFVPTRRAFPHVDPGVSDGVFMTSRDGRSFKRWGEAWIRPGPQEERWVNRNNMTAWGIVETRSDLPGTPNELSVYSTEGYYGSGAARLRRYTLRIDGFVSVQAPLSGGEVVTKPLVFSGRELVINYSTSAAGSVRVEIQDDAGQPLPGYALADATEIFGDHLERAVTWKSDGGDPIRDVSALAGRPIRLRFTLSDADLYSLRFR